MSFSEVVKRALFRLRGRVLHFSPQGNAKGTVLMCYVTLPFFRKKNDPLLGHTNYWESKDMVRAFLERRYSVDLIDTSNHTFVPKKAYDIFVDNGTNINRLAPLLSPECLKVFHITTSHWRFQNDAARARAKRVSTTRGVLLEPDRVLPPSQAIELCDFASMLGNNATAETYAYARKHIVPLPISTTHMYESPKQKNFAEIRKNFIWFGGAGALHKGLDLVLEAFAQMPNFHLTVCGKVRPQDAFAQVYKKEMYHTPNIRTIGWVDPGGAQFKAVCRESVGAIYPSCAEGQAGSVVLAMHAGLIPIVSRESGVNVGHFGVTLKKNTVEAVQEAVTRIAAEPPAVLEDRAVATWQFTRAHHTRAAFAKAYRAFVDTIEKKYNK